MPVVGKIQKVTSARYPGINIACSVVPLPHRLLSKPTSVQKSLLLDDSPPEREMMKRQEKMGSRKRRRRMRMRRGERGGALKLVRAV